MATVRGSEPLTNVPPERPRLVSTRPASLRIASASLRVTTEIPSERASLVSRGSWSPGRSSPIAIACPRRATASATALPWRMGVKTVRWTRLSTNADGLGSLSIR